MNTHLGRRARPLIPLILLASGASLLSACADSARPAERQVVEIFPPTGLHTPEFDDAGNWIPPDGGPPYEPPSEARTFLASTGDLEPSVHVNGELELSVLLLDAEIEPLRGESVQFEIIDSDAGAARLSSQRAATNAAGVATVTLHAGDLVREYTLEATHRDAAQAVRFTVRVVDMPAGGLEIALDYQGGVGLGLIEIYLLEDARFCEDPYYLTPPSEVEFSGSVEAVFDRVEISPLLAGQRFSVLARARHHESGVLVAGGCTGNALVVEEELNRITVQLNLLQLNPAGTYDTVNHFNFEGAVPGTLGRVIDELVIFFGSSTQERQIGTVIFDLVHALVEEAIGGLAALVVDLARGWLEDDLNDIINGWIDEDAPDWVRDFLLIGRDLLQVVSELEVLGELRLSKPRLDGSFNGNQRWTGLAFYWTTPCEGAREEACRYEVGLGDLHAEAEGLELIYGQFSGQLYRYDEGIIEAHVMDLQYGRLILFVLNQIILPEIAGGATSLREALLYAADCPAFAEGITGGDGALDFAGVDIADDDDIEGWCTDAMILIGDLGNAILGRLRVDTRLTLRGELTFVEETDDLIVDRIEGGAWQGTIRTQEGDEGPPFRGDFRGDAQRQASPPDSGEGGGA